jgi:hypothetical protein
MYRLYPTAGEDVRLGSNLNLFGFPCRGNPDTLRKVTRLQLQNKIRFV